MSDSPEDIVKRLRFYAETTDPSQHPTARGFFGMAANLIERLTRAKPQPIGFPAPDPDSIAAQTQAVYVVCQPNADKEPVRAFPSFGKARGFCDLTGKYLIESADPHERVYPIVKIPFEF